ncbi:Toxin HigB-2 [Aquisphaera giovannonii]|uniref:Toxin HigB-2 n=1 Tax=Aquisphaera giovannonii TaxID=406548 RepID=A0A5B9VV93_9BACT|nr:hypothetical protein [Aquisphaera giovannonii]QEH32273.1 Toxin HigB-2 [Aquisphaera giovannonii]
MFSDDHLKVIRSYRLTPGPLATFIEIGAFTSQWEQLGLTDADRYVLQLSILAQPSAGLVVAGTNGIRKIRFNPPGSGRGKSGAYRVFYLYAIEHQLVFLLGVLSKTEKANLTKAQRNALAGLVIRIKSSLEVMEDRK